MGQVSVISNNTSLCGTA